MAAVKSALNILRNILFVIAVIVILTAGFCVAMKIMPGIIMSGSMEPTIHTGSLAFVDCKKAQPEKGDIIAFYRGEELVTHRVIDITAEGLYITKGDANEAEDPWLVATSDIKGETVFCLPYLGYALKGLSTPRGIILCAAFAVLILLGSFLPSGESKTKRLKGERGLP